MSVRAAFIKARLDGVEEEKRRAAEEKKKVEEREKALWETPRMVEIRKNIDTAVVAAT